MFISRNRHIIMAQNFRKMPQTHLISASYRKRGANGPFYPSAPRKTAGTAGNGPDARARSTRKRGGSMRHILVVDDDIHIGNLLQEALEGEGCRVSRAYSGTEAVLALDRERPDLILLDLTLPGLSGEEVLPRLAGIPVIVVSAKADTDSKTALLLGGAADYVTKPFALRELLARVEARLREAPLRPGSALAFQNLRLDPDARSVSIDGEPVRLTRTEYAILKLLMASPAQVVTKSALLDRIAQDTPDCTESSLKTHVSNLRKKLRDAGAGDCIESVWGIGFKMKTE